MFLIFNMVLELLILNMVSELLILNIHIAYVESWGVRLHYKKGRPLLPFIPLDRFEAS